MYQELIDSNYTTLRRNLLKEKGSEVQKEFIRACRDDNAFVELMRQQVGATEGKAVPQLPTPLSEHEFKEPPKDTEAIILATWADIEPALACRNTFWGMVTLKQIEASVISSTFLSANGVNGTSGKARIDHALQSGKAKELDACVRTILRRFSGLPEARGNRSIYVNCPLARGWWRQRLCGEVIAATDCDESDVMRVLRLSQEYWENIVSMMVSRNSVFGDRSVRDVVVAVVARTIKEDPSHSLAAANNLRLLARRLGARAAWQEFSVLLSEELTGIVDSEIAQSVSP